MKQNPGSALPVLRWYVLYTHPRAERKVQVRLQQLHIDSFVPFIRKKHQWHDRVKTLSIPLFPGYVFVLLDFSKRHLVFQVKEIVKFISFGGKPATISSSIIQSLKSVIGIDCDIRVENTLTIGTNVRITKGAFTGIEGIVMNRNGKSRLIIQLDVLQKSIVVNLSEFDMIQI